jgi:hypothetical protein
LMKRLEGEVLEALANLRFQEEEALHWLEGHSIDPHQFLGLEVNPRAAAIAELVLWIGYLQWHFRTRGGVPPEPILRDFKTIQVTDAVLAWSRKDLARDEHGRPIVRTDAEGNRVEVWRYVNPKRPEWPAADYIIGNPPFVGGKDIRGRLGEGYAEALWAAHPHMNESADFVMYWWDRAAELSTRKGTRLKRFGFVTTNSLSQVFQRRVMERYLKAKKPISLLMAIPDHPWTKATRDAAAVRIAMTVAALGPHEGRLYEVTKEENLDTDEPVVELRETLGRINSDLTAGADVTALFALNANAFISSRGVVLHGSGFIVTSAEVENLGLGKRSGLECYIKPYCNGRDLMSISRGVMALDLFGLGTDDIRKRFPEVYQHILAKVKPERDHNPREYRREKWWLFGENVPDFRKALKGLPRYVATAETAKHRVFQFLDASILPDNKLVCIALSDACQLGVLSSRFHTVWALRTGGWLGVGNDPVYVKSKCFDPFPFPDVSDALKIRIRETAEELDALRKQVRAEHARLTLTQIYNVLEKLRAGQELTDDDEAIKNNGLVLILRELHDKLDSLVAEAYGWPADLSEDETLARLVALNAERAAEEKRGLVRWLRADYQRPRAGVVDAQAAAEADAQIVAPLIAEAGKIQKPTFPTNDLERAAAVFAALINARAPIDARSLAATFKQGGKVEPAISRVLSSLARLGHVHTSDGIAFALRRSA